MIAPQPPSRPTPPLPSPTLLRPASPHTPADLCSTAAALLPRLPFHAASFARLFRCPCLFSRGGMGNLHSQEHPPILFSRRAAFGPSRVRRMTLWMFLVGTLSLPTLLCATCFAVVDSGCKSREGGQSRLAGGGSVCGICRWSSTRSAWFITNSLRTCQPPPAPQRSSRKPLTLQQRALLQASGSAACSQCHPAR